MGERVSDHLVFEAGNLIHGAPINSFGRIYHEGIRPAIVINGEEDTDTPDEICFGMIPNYPTAAERYAGTGHKGPRIEDSSTYDEMASIVVSRFGLIKRFGEDIRAIGFHFSGRNRRDELYDFSKEAQRVNDIAIWRSGIVHAGYDNQVRLYASDLNKTHVREEIWQEVVVKDQKVDKLLNSLRGVGCVMRVPIYNPSGELLLPAGKDKKIFSLGEISVRKELVVAS